VFLSASKQDDSAFLHRSSFENLKVLREGTLHSCNGVDCFIEFVFVELIESIRKSFEDSFIPSQCIAPCDAYVIVVSICEFSD